MVDLHIHTLYSDGENTVEEVLRKCEQKKLEYISITDHNTCKQYEDNAFKMNIFTGKIIKGSEMNATFKDKKIEFLAYNIKNLEMINEWSDKFFSYQILKEKFERDKKRIIEICDKNGLVYDLSAIKKEIPVTDFFSVYLYYELLKHEENIDKMKPYVNSFNDFWKNGMANPESIFYTGPDNYPKPNFTDVANIIHKAGGLVFLAHPFEYRFDNTLGFIDELRKQINLDGIECFHPSSEEENKTELLIAYARKNSLYISGGSDFHGNKKPNIEIGTGSGSLNIPKEYIEEWVEN